jgi:hypothetical protein
MIEKERLDVNGVIKSRDTVVVNAQKKRNALLRDALVVFALQ